MKVFSGLWHWKQLDKYFPKCVPQKMSPTKRFTDQVLNDEMTLGSAICSGD